MKHFFEFKYVLSEEVFFQTNYTLFYFHNYSIFKIQHITDNWYQPDESTSTRTETLDNAEQPTVTWDVSHEDNVWENTNTTDTDVSDISTPHLVSDNLPLLADSVPNLT